MANMRSVKRRSHQRFSKSLYSVAPSSSYEPDENNPAFALLQLSCDKVIFHHFSAPCKAFSTRLPSFVPEP